jgi:predicted amidohydrolase YtcJ
MMLEDQIGSLEAGKLADFAVLDRDILACPIDDVLETRVMATYLEGKKVFERKS